MATFICRMCQDKRHASEKAAWGNYCDDIRACDRRNVARIKREHKANRRAQQAKR